MPSRYLIRAKHSHFSEVFEHTQDFTALAERSCGRLHPDMHSATSQRASKGTGVELLHICSGRYAHESGLCCCFAIVGSEDFGRSFSETSRNVGIG